jgi:hypothetical protein
VQAAAFSLPPEAVRRLPVAEFERRVQVDDKVRKWLGRSSGGKLDVESAVQPASRGTSYLISIGGPPVGALKARSVGLVGAGFFWT